MAARTAEQADTDTVSTAKVATGGAFLAELAFADGGETPPIIHQRIYDTVLGQYVYYTKSTVDPAPAVGDTSPNHSGNLDAAKHEVL